MIRVLLRAPMSALTVVGALLTALVAFGVDLTPEQIAAIGAVGAAVVRLVHAAQEGEPSA